MKEILTISLAVVFLLGCTQQRVEAPANATSITKSDTNKVKSSKNNKGEPLEIDLKKPEQMNTIDNGIASLGGGIGSSPILQMVGSALLTGIISGLVSKALQ